MLARGHRFHSRNAVQAVYRQGQTIRGPQINLKVVRRPTDRPYRVAVVVSRKVHKSAVVRNRIRRRIYELCRLYDQVALAQLDLVFLVFSDELSELPAAKLQALVFGLLDKATKSAP